MRCHVKLVVNPCGGKNKFEKKEGWFWVEKKILSCKLWFVGWLEAACKSVFFLQRWLL